MKEWMLILAIILVIYGVLLMRLIKEYFRNRNLSNENFYNENIVDDEAS